jgi:Flp pilus assembly protein TadD
VSGRVRCESCGERRKQGWARCPRCGDLRVAVETVASEPNPLHGFFRRPGVIALGCVSFSLVLFVVFVTGPLRHERNDAGAAESILERVGPANAALASVDDTAAPYSSPVTSLDFDRAGAAAYAEGKFAVALERFEEAVKLNPNDPRVLNNLGQALVRVGRAQKALPLFVRATELNPSEWQPRFNLAHAYGSLERWKDAIPEYQKAAQLFPDDYVTQYNLGLAFHKAGQEELAVGAFQRAIVLAPGEPSFHLSLGISYERLNEKAKAAQAYQTYLEMAPSASDAEKIRSHIEALRAPA